MSNAVVRIVLFSVAILILTGILLSVLAFDSFRFLPGTDAPTEQITTDSVTADIRNIEIEWVAGSITLRKDPNVTQLVIQEESAVDSKHRMVLKQSGQTLKIKFSEEAVRVVGINVSNYTGKNLIVTVPEDWTCNSLEIDTASAEVVINDLTIREFDFDGASGDCRLTNCKVDEMDVDTASGKVDFSGTLQVLDCDAASADCTIEVSNVPRSIKLNALSGDLDLILPPDAGFSCVSKTASGSFDTDFDCDTVGSTYTHGDRACQIELDAASGDISILKGIA